MNSNTNNSNQPTKEICEAFNSLALTKVPQIVLKNEHLQKLFLDYNEIVTLPKELCTKCRHLNLLSLVGNDLTELPPNIGNLELLEELYVNENKLQKFPEGLTKCCMLQIINFVGNKIRELPDDIERLACLQKIYGDENEVGHFPQHFGLLGDLQVAEFSSNQIKELPQNFGNLTKLQVLNLSSNKLLSLPKSFCNLPNVIELDISCNNLSDLPHTFSSAQCLRRFFAETNVIETLPSWLNNLPSLEEISLKDNQLKGKPLSDSFGETSTHLHILELAGNFISDLPVSIGNLTRLENVHLGSVIGELERRNFQNGNWIWKVPDSITKLVNLRELHIDENQLCELPTAFGDLVHLETLDLGQNRLSDLPPSFGNLRSLRVCQLSKNFLEILPSNFGELLQLQDLRLDNNSLAELPESFSQLASLKTLDLFNNHLEAVPDCLPHLKNLVRLDISENKFGLHHMNVPQVVIQNKYSPRDPSQRDNWRGRPRQDLLQVEVKDVEVPSENYGKIPDEPEEEETSFNYRAYESAMRSNFSLWKSHTDTSSKREKFVHPQLYSKMVPPQVDRNDAEISPVHRSGVQQAQFYESGINSDSISADYVVYKMEAAEEDWDKECEAQDNESNPYDTSPRYSPGTMLGFKPSRLSDEHLFIPSESHVLNHIRRPCNVRASSMEEEGEEGQFEDVDDDSWKM